MAQLIIIIEAPSKIVADDILDSFLLLSFIENKSGISYESFARQVSHVQYQVLFSLNQWKKKKKKKKKKKINMPSAEVVIGALRVKVNYIGPGTTNHNAICQQRRPRHESSLNIF